MFVPADDAPENYKQIWTGRTNDPNEQKKKGNDSRRHPSGYITNVIRLMSWTNNGCKGTQIFSYLQIFCEQFAKNLHFCPFSCDLSDFLHRIGELYSRTNCERLYASFCTLRERQKRTTGQIRAVRPHFLAVYCTVYVIQYILFNNLYCLTICVLYRIIISFNKQLNNCLTVCYSWTAVYV